MPGAYPHEAQTKFKQSLSLVNSVQSEKKKLLLLLLLKEKKYNMINTYSCSYASVFNMPM